MISELRLFGSSIVEKEEQENIKASNSVDNEKVLLFMAMMKQ